MKKLKSLIVEAKTENLLQVQEFVTAELESHDCSPKAQMQIEIAVEEIFVNIASYAYNPETGNAEIRVEVLEDPLRVSITFLDNGVPFDPVSRADADISPEAIKSRIGGLGIHMVKKYMDDVTYSYENGQNILTIKKNL